MFRKKTRVGDADRRIKDVKVVRAVYHSPDVQEVDVNLLMEDGEIITLVLPSRLAGKLSLETANAHEAIHPPLTRGSFAAGWQGME